MRIILAILLISTSSWALDDDTWIRTYVGGFGHSVYETPDGIPMIIDSSYEGVRFRPVSWGALAADGYIAIRYNNIVEDDDPLGTASNPIVLELGQRDVSVEGNTRDAVSLEFHRYALEPAARQAGPEIAYKMLKTAFDPKNKKFLAKVHRQLKTLSPSFDGMVQMGIPLHAGAVKYYKEQGMTIPAALIAD